MATTRTHIIHTIILALSLSAGPVFSQTFYPQINISLGGGGNISYFGIGGGSPSLSLVTSSMYQWNDHWKAGINIAYHRVVGTDEGTAHFVRGLAYNSSFYELSGRTEYIIYFSSFRVRKWKQRLNPQLPYGGTWKRNIKPFIYAGGGLLHYLPYLYNYSTETGIDENPGIASITAVVNAGLGIYYHIGPFLALSLEAGSNLPFFDYTSVLPDVEFFNKVDTYHHVALRLIWKQPVGFSVFHGGGRAR